MSDSTDGLRTPASIPYTTGEHVILLNGKVLTEADQRLPDPELPIDGNVKADGELGDDLVSVSVHFGHGGVKQVYVNVIDTDRWTDMTYELSKSDDQPDAGQRWTTRRSDPEYTVDIAPITEVNP